MNFYLVSLGPDVSQVTVSVVKEKKPENNTDQTDHTKPIHSVDDLENMYSDRFSGMGNFGNKVTLALKPVIHPPRKCKR